MYKNVDDMTDEELCYCLAKAGAAECYIYGASYNSRHDSVTNVFQESSHKLYRPTRVADQFCLLLDKYKPYISYTADSVCVEVLSGYCTEKYATKLQYATVKDYGSDVKKALCKAIVALHYGYGFDLEELRGK